MQNKKRIPVSDNVAYTQWEMPDLTGVKRRIAQRLKELKQEEIQEEELVVEPAIPTSEELIALKEQAHQEGYAAGFSEGDLAGQEEGRALGYQEGEKTGQEAGFQLGYQRGLDQAEQEVDQQLARLQSIIEQLQGPLAALDYEVENALLSLVDLVCRAILRREIKLERKFLTEVLQEAVAALPAGHQRLRIFLNPEDLNLAEAACQDLLEDYRLVGDPEVTLGGAKIETLQSLVDSTLESRYKKIIDKLLGGAYQPSAADLKPLPEQVLSTPDTPPLEEAVFTEPKLTTTEFTAPEFTKSEQEMPEQEMPEQEMPEQEMPEQEILATEEQPEANLEPEELAETPDSAVDNPTPEPVAQVSLQRGKAPRHQLASQPLPAAEEDGKAEALNDPEALFDEGKNEVEVVADTAVTDDNAAKLDEQLEATDEVTASVDSFLDEFAEEELPEDVSTPTSNQASMDDLANIEALEATESLENTESLEATEGVEEQEVKKDWTAETVHEDRYLDLDDLSESTWVDDETDNQNG